MRTPMSTQPGPATPALTTHFEPYVSVEKAAEYLDVAPKTLLEKARKGEVPAYPWGNGMRKIWRFKSIRTAKYTVDGGARGMREVFRSVSWPPRFWA